MLCYFQIISAFHGIHQLLGPQINIILKSASDQTTDVVFPSTVSGIAKYKQIVCQLELTHIEIGITEVT